MPIFTIDGNIGCGKSTILDFLHTQYHYSIDVEPIAKWQPFLEEMYRHNRGAFNFQVRVWLDRCWIQEKPNMSLVMERAPFFQVNSFVPINLENGRITAKEYESLNEMYDKTFKMWSPSGMVYLRSNPDRCLHRIHRRARSSEESIEPRYLRRLHDFHESAYLYGLASGIPIAVVDVEGKTVAQIAQDVHLALQAFGARPTL